MSHPKKARLSWILVLVPTSQGLRRGQPRARARQSVATAASCSCSGSYQALPIQSLDVGHNREKDNNSQNEETSGGRRLRPTHRRARRCRAKRLSARPAADKAGRTKRTLKPDPVDAAALRARARARRRARGRFGCGSAALHLYGESVPQ